MITFVKRPKKHLSSTGSEGIRGRGVKKELRKLWVGTFLNNTLSVSSQQHIHLTQYLLLFFNNILPCNSGRLWDILVGFSMKWFFFFCQPSSSLLTVKVFKCVFPWRSPSALSVPLMSDGHGAAPGLLRWRLSAAWQEILSLWAVLAAPVCIYEARRERWWDGTTQNQPKNQNWGLNQNLDGGI